MISKALQFISEYLSNEIKLTFGTNEDKVVISSLINPDGSVSEVIENKIVISVINLEHETTVNKNGSYFEGRGGNYGKVAPPVYLNLYLLFSANYDAKNYLEALKLLSNVIAVFQSNTCFERKNYPEMDASLDKLTFEIYNMPISDLSHIWSGIGAKYLPSIIYKVRMITVQKNLIKEEIPGVGGLNT